MKKFILIFVIFLLIGFLSVFFYKKQTLKTVTILEEAGSSEESVNFFWWLNSGGLMTLNDNGGETVQGKLPDNNKWRALYLKVNPEDTDEGFRPQNIFRLLTKNKFQNFTEEARFVINQYNLSDSSNRDQSNAVLLFGRYENSDNLYYAGIRVDGYSVIKKKVKGEYFVVDERLVFNSVESYDRKDNPNLLPINTPITLKLVVEDRKNTVHLKLFTMIGDEADFKLIAEGDDIGQYGGLPLQNNGSVGIRTDFMDIKFSNFSVKQN